MDKLKQQTRILSRTVFEDHKTWHDKLPFALWVYCKQIKERTNSCNSISLVYGTKVILPAATLVPSARIALDTKLHDVALTMLDLETLEERRDWAEKNAKVYQR